MNHQFTPGPWFWTGKELHSLDGAILYAGLVIEATEADARLIQSAPDLFRQLAYAVKILGAFPTLHGTAQVQSMREALAKASGGAS